MAQTAVLSHLDIRHGHADLGLSAVFRFEVQHFPVVSFLQVKVPVHSHVSEKRCGYLS